MAFNSTSTHQHQNGDIYLIYRESQLDGIQFPNVIPFNYTYHTICFPATYITSHHSTSTHLLNHFSGFFITSLYSLAQEATFQQATLAGGNLVRRRRACHLFIPAWRLLGLSGNWNTSPSGIRGISWSWISGSSRHCWELLFKVVMGPWFGFFPLLVIPNLSLRLTQVVFWPQVLFCDFFGGEKLAALFSPTQKLHKSESLWLSELIAAGPA